MEPWNLMSNSVSYPIYHNDKKVYEYFITTYFLSRKHIGKKILLIPLRVESVTGNLHNVKMFEFTMGG